MSKLDVLKAGATYDDLRSVPEHLVAEIVDGELYATPRPALPHARAASVLGFELIGPFDRSLGGPAGWWILDEPELHLKQSVVVPDLAGWRRDRLPAIPREPALSLAPDWICEILSPTTEALDRVKKLAVYAREGVQHAWLLNPTSQTLEVLRLEGGRWFVLAWHAGTEKVRAEPFDAIELDLSVLWSGTELPDAGSPTS